MKSNRKRQRKWWFTLFTLLSFCLFLFLWKASCEKESHWTPDYPRRNLKEIIQQCKEAESNIVKQDYEVIRLQTGLGKSAVDKMIQRKAFDEIIEMQDRLFAKASIKCTQNSPISWEEKLIMGEEMLPLLVPLEDGDILYTPNSHTFGWRNGHVAIVVDGKKGVTLESVVLGEDSAIQSVEKWRKYPAFLVLRLKNVTQEERRDIADQAITLLNEVPYGFSGDLTDSFETLVDTKNTHCAHLVWKAYALAGYNLDSDGGRIVTPRDIASSPLLEVLQSYGIPMK